METIEKCQAGCKIFYGGEIKHDKNCVFYHESLTQLYEGIEAENKELREMLESVKNELCHCIDELQKKGAEVDFQTPSEIEELLNKERTQI